MVTKTRGDDTARGHAERRRRATAHIHLALTIMAVAATFAAAARAGVGPIAEPPDAIAAAEAYHDFLSENAPGTVTPLIDYMDIDMPAPDCTQGRKPEVHAILIGASVAGAPFGKLSGPDNDVALLAKSLEARGVEAADMAVLTGDKAGRETLKHAMRTTLLRSGCGDRVIFHFGGNAARPIERTGHEGGDIVFVRK